MPYVTIRVTGDPITTEQNNALISRTTTMIEDVLGKDPEITWVVVEEVPSNRWGIGGRTYADRQQNARGS